MIDHLTTYAMDFDATKKFYDATLPVLGYERNVEMTASWDQEFPERRLCAYGPGAQPVFWVCEVKESYTPRHLAFAAADRPLVDTWYEAAMGAGGIDNGGPGERPIYHPGYYGAFALDPDGNNVEAVCHVPPAE